MVSQTLYITGMMVFTFTSQMYQKISVRVPVLEWVPEYLSMSTRTSTITLELTSTSKVRVQEIQYSSTANTSTEYKYTSPGTHPQRRTHPHRRSLPTQTHPPTQMHHHQTHPSTLTQRTDNLTPYSKKENANHPHNYKNFLPKWKNPRQHTHTLKLGLFCLPWEVFFSGCPEN